MKSSKVMEKINNRLLAAFFLLLITGFIATVTVIFNCAFLIDEGIEYIPQFFKSTVIPIEFVASIPLFILLAIYYNKLLILKHKIEERSWQMSTSFCVILDFIIKK